MKAVRFPARTASAAGFVVLLLLIATTAVNASPHQAMVQIKASVSPVDVFEPWKRMGAQAVQGSGFVLPDGRILTNAHVVQEAVSVRVKQERTTRTFDARVLFVQSQTDLALLEVEDEAFNPGSHSIDLGELPALEQAVQALGYPEGGEGLSVTSGVVSRIEMELVVNSFEYHLLLQTDAAINAGNSGGPLLADGRCVGLATMGLTEAENIAYAIPEPLIRQFLNDIDDGRLDGVPRLGAQIGILENPAERRWLRVPEQVQGAVVMQVAPGSALWGHLEPGDVITSIDGEPIAQDHTIEGPKDLRLDFSVLTETAQCGKEIAVEFVRQGETKKASIELADFDLLVKRRGADQRREYLVYGGAQFQPLTMDYLLLYEDFDAPAALQAPWIERRLPSEKQRELVVLSRVLPHPINRGYEDMVDLIVAKVDDTVPVNFAHFVSLAANGSDEFARIDFASGEKMVFDRNEVAEIQEELLTVHGIPKDMYVSSPYESTPAR